MKPDHDENADDQNGLASGDSLEIGNGGSSLKLNRDEMEDSNSSLQLQVPEVLHSSSVEKEMTRSNEGECGALGTNETNVLKILGEVMQWSLEPVCAHHVSIVLLVSRAPFWGEHKPSHYRIQTPLAPLF